MLNLSFLNMKSIWFLVLAGLLSCTQDKESEITAPVDTKPVVLKEKKKVIPKKVSNNNVEDTLTKYGDAHPETLVDIYTSKGKIRIRLFKDTPLHRASFLMLANKKYFDGTVFIRVVKGFMAQCGSPATYTHTDLQGEIGVYTIPHEITINHFHKKGAIGAAREYDDNPEKRSDPYNFYFVEGTRFSSETLDKYEKINTYQYSSSQRSYYAKNEGAAHIDGQHTVFGEIVSGYSIVPKLTHVETDRQDWPIDDIYLDSVVVVR